MWFMYEYAENEITELNRSYDTRLSEEEKKKIFIPTYDCMKKYQGSWHMEQKPAFRNCFLIECRDRDTSQCSPLSPEVGKRYAEPSNRKERGLYRDGNRVYNADAVGAYNILRKYHSVSGVKRELSVTGLKTPEIMKVAV